MRTSIYWKAAGVCLAGALLLLTAPFMLLLRPASAAAIHKELVYLSLIDRYIRPGDAPLQQVYDLFTFTRMHEFMYKGYPVIDKDPLNDLVRGIGWCDQQANLIVTLAQRLGIKGHILALHRKGVSVSQHSVAEVEIGGRWFMFDPSLARIYRNRSTGSVMSAREIQDAVTAGRFSDLINIVEPGEQAGLDLYAGPFRPFGVNYNQIGVLRALVRSLARLDHRLFGRLFTRVYQDAYFALYDRGRAPDDLYRRAKLYYLTGRYEKADATFAEVLAAPKPFWDRGSALLWRGVNLYRMHRYPESLRTLEELRSYVNGIPPRQGGVDVPRVGTFVINLYQELNCFALGRPREAKRYAAENQESILYRKWIARKLLANSLIQPS
ncbi:MAG: hypothetical protein A2992_09845 [Elusimicrobia bacterium RIFCSPLOWO2_01_FULL_59_12]|nr:MAG: hypothetical protein A2992_09845 [Elusimicrobia bacterium RIFCSPLOWO2_01_FULL_59_12]